jgi:RimJ/RimL family protein N-acetyltransferase
LGFTLEGRLRDCELIDGEFHDDLVFSRLATDAVGACR